MGIGYNPKIITRDLRSHLDAANIKSYPGSGATWSDLSGNGVNGTLYNIPTFESNTISFNGSDEYATVYPATFSMTDCTLSLWIYLDNTIPWGVRFDVFSTDIGSGVSGRLLLYRETATILSFYALFGSLTPRAIQITGADTLMTGKWKNLVLTSKTIDTTTTMNTYIDGEFYKTLEVPEAATATNATWYLMRNQNGSYPVKGKISVASIYTRALSADEVKQNFNALRGRYGI